VYIYIYIIIYIYIHIYIYIFNIYLQIFTVFVAILLPFATVPHGQLRDAAARCVASRATPGEAALGFAESGTGTGSKGATVMPCKAVQICVPKYSSSS
jgi:hypothetical protein